MKIIGAGFGRTGTTSLKAALETLGYDPCYHMQEAFKHISHSNVWQAAHRGQTVDWQHFLRNYQAGVDFPISNFYQELQVAFPDAKVLLSVRDSDSWYDSTLATIYQMASIPRWLIYALPPMGIPNRMATELVWDGLFDGRFEDRAHAIGVYERHIAQVKATVPPEQLLVFSVKEGWEPLCDFLGCVVPDEPFPHLNDRKVIQRAAAGLHAVGRWVPRLLLMLTVASSLRLFRRR